MHRLSSWFRDVSRAVDVKSAFRIGAVLLCIHAASPSPCGAQGPTDSATALLKRGERQYYVARFDSALASWTAALPLLRATGDRKREAAALSDIGAVYARIGRPDSAVAYLRRALPIRRAVGDRAGEAETRNNLGEVFRGTGYPDSALAYFRTALAIHRVARGDTVAWATTLSNIGAVYSGIGRMDSALTFLGAALPLLRATGNRSGEGSTLSIIGTIHYRARRPDSSLAYHLAALSLLRAAGDRPGEAISLSNVGAVLREMGRADSALAYHRAALPLLRALGDRVGEAAANDNLGGDFRKLGQLDSALFYHRAAIAPSRAAGDRAREALVLSHIGDVYGDLGRPLAAVAALDTASALLTTVRMHAGSDASAVAYSELERQTGQSWVKQWLALANADRSPERTAAVAAALAAAERGRAQGLRDLLARSGAASRTDAGRALWDQDTLPGADLAAEVGRELAPLRRTRTAALYYYVADDVMTSWFLSPSGELRLTGHTMVTADSVAALVASLRAALGVDAARTRTGRGTPAAGRAVGNAAGQPSSRLRVAAAALGALLVPTAEMRDVPAGAELAIVPHGALSLVPFAALTTSDDSLPLGIRYALRYAPSLRALAAAEASVAPSLDEAAGASLAAGGSGRGRALVVGDPTMPAIVRAGGRRVPLRSLPAARVEGLAVARILGVAPLMSGSATETAIREALPSAAIVHLATHGVAFGSDARARESYIALAPDTDNDGFLTIGELLDEVPALAADLVVLSACQTALGGDLKRDEGTVGFQRALLARGARSVLVSLWSVDDRATANLMRRFYAHWRGVGGRPARSKAEALRLAQAELRAMAEFASPKYWAAFQLVGAQ